MGGRERARSSGAARARSQGARTPRPHVLDGGGAGVRLLARAGQRRLLLADPARRACCSPSRRCRVDRAQGGRAGWRTLPTCSRTTTCRRSSSPPRRAAGQETEELEAARSLPRPRRRTGASPRRPRAPRRAWPGRSSSPRRSIPRAALLERWAKAAQQRGRLEEARGTRGSDRPLPRARRNGQRREGAVGAFHSLAALAVRRVRKGSLRLSRC